MRGAALRQHAARDGVDRKLGDTPYPPNDPKMPGEPRGCNRRERSLLWRFRFWTVRRFGGFEGRGAGVRVLASHGRYRETVDPTFNFVVKDW